ncbi:hypothetical protein, partial [Haloechinothrix alba]|uniref:hypothetical protein n=1 Tax=Haloechinothrix alba TaxID=664784 RepID=UPI001C3D5D75
RHPATLRPHLVRKSAQQPKQTSRSTGRTRQDPPNVAKVRAAKVEILVRQARSQVEIAVEIVRLGR